MVLLPLLRASHHAWLPERGVQPGDPIEHMIQRADVTCTATAACLRRRLANRESARRVRQKRVDAQSTIQVRWMQHAPGLLAL